MNDPVKTIISMEDQDQDQDQAQVFSWLSEHLSTSPVSKSRLESLEKRLESRIHNSIIKHAGLHTIRARDKFWQDLTTGIRYKPLWESQQGNSVLIEFAPGAALPIHRHSHLEEGIVLSGELQLDDQELTQFDYHVSPPGSHHGRISSKQGAIAYLRGSSIGQPLSMLKELVGAYLPDNHQKSQSITSKAGDWEHIHQGVFVKELWTDGRVSSRLCRLEAGACIDGHDHPLDEECMMLSGDIFLGDILLQAGDYQIASAGSVHLDITSDTGALLFVRGVA